MSEARHNPAIGEISPGRLILGTAQFGMAYGVTNRLGQVPADGVTKILAAAHAAGISTVDTAAAYGASEAVLGECLTEFPTISVITKTPAFPGDAIGSAELDALRRGLERSLTRLRRPRVDALLLHHGSDLLKSGGSGLGESLNRLKSQGLATRIGISVYDGVEIDGILERFHPDIVQLPLNLFDQRLAQSGHLARLKAAGIEVHARSIFLQGLLLADAAKLQGHFAGFAKHFSAYASRLARDQLTPLQACLGFALCQGGADRAVIGVTETDELRAILAALASNPAAPGDLSKLAVDDIDLVDPRRWPAG